MERRDLTGKILAQRYELLSFLGNGAFGAVYEGRNELGKRFAIKVLLAPEVTGNSQLMGRFFREAKAAAAIHSAHIVDVYETGIDGALDVPFIVMELLHGEDLEKAMERIGAFEPTFAARVVTQAALGLEKAHAAGVVHRDVKPANIFLSTLDAGDVLVKVLDFGIAKATQDSMSSVEQASLTRTGTVMGTPLYMSPEQAQGLKIVDERADVWSLGVCLFHMLAGQVPWGDAQTLAALAVKICAQDAPPVTQLAPWVAPELAAVVTRTLKRDLDQRTRSMRALIEELAPFCAGTTQLARTSMTGVQGAPKTEPRVIAQTASMSAVQGTVRTVAGEPALPVRSKRWTIAAIAAGVALVGAGALAIAMTTGRGSSGPTVVPVTPAAADPAPTTSVAQTAITTSTTTTTTTVTATVAATATATTLPTASTKPAATTVTKTAAPKPKSSAKTPVASDNGDPFGGTKN